MDAVKAFHFFYSVIICNYVGVMRRNILLLTVILITQFSANAQFEGLMKFKVEYTENNFSDFSAMSPKAYTYYFSKLGAKVVPEGDSAKFETTIFRFGTKKKPAEVFMVSDLGKQVVRIVDYKQSTSVKRSFQELVGEEEKVGKYNCKKYLLNDAFGKVTVWMTEEIEVDQRLIDFDAFLPLAGLNSLKGFPVKIIEEYYVWKH